MTDADQVAALRVIVKLQKLLEQEQHFRKCDSECFREVADQRDEARRERNVYRAENARMAKQLVKLTDANRLFAQVNEAIRKASKNRKGRK